MLKNAEAFSRRAWAKAPSWPCPKCKNGTLIKKDELSKDIEHGWSEDAHRHEAWEPEWVSGAFFWTMCCSSQDCRHFVIVTGETEVDWDIQDNGAGWEQIWLTYFVPRSFSHAPPIFVIPEKTPDNVRALVEASFHLFWVDAASCLNRIRVCIEELLTIEKVARFRISNGKRKIIPLHSRIQAFKEKNDQVGELLMALKWLGNDGSHSNARAKQIERSHLLDAMEILEYSLEAIFDPKSASLAKTAKKINKKKGI